MPAPQSAKSHASFDSVHHYLITPVLLVNSVVSLFFWNSDHHNHPFLSLWWIILSVTIFLLSIKTRTYSLRVQDRLIRLEERLRLSALLPSSEHTLIPSFTTRQLIALRFASDAELPTLARRALAENLDPKQIKQSIANWRPDHDRI